MTDGAAFAATTWVERLLIGQVAWAIATIAVAVLGLTMMAGRLPARRGMEVIAGIFLIVGAPLIAGGLAGAMPQQADAPPPAPAAATVHTAPPPPSTYDPYAGASVPQRRDTSKILTTIQ